MRSIIEIVTAIRSPIVIVLATLLVSNANAQPIIGIGDFKIGMPIIDFLNSPEIRNKTIKESSSGDSLSQMSDEETVFKTDSKTQVEDYRRIFSEGLKKYQFKMSLGEGEISKPTLTAEFYEGILIKLFVKEGFSLDFRKLLIKKYGEPKVTNNMKLVVCQNGYGAKFERLEGVLTYEWGSDNPINAEIRVSFTNCGKDSFIFYTVKDVAKEELKYEAEHKLFKAYIKEIEQKKSASSKL